MKRLVEIGVLRFTEKHTESRPRYELLSWPEICELRRLAPAKKEQAGDMIWLPTTIVTGTHNNENSPVRRLRDAGDIWTLRLFVDMYRSQNLRDDRGISPWCIRQVYERQNVGECGLYKIWAFKLTHTTIDGWNHATIAPHKTRLKKSGDTKHPFWESVEHLEMNGLLTFVPHLWQRDSRDAEVIHVYGVDGYPDQLEQEIAIGREAHAAAQRMGAPWLIEAAARNGFVHLIPVEKGWPDAQLIGVGRLRYRPHTARTSAWMSELLSDSSHWISQFQEMGRSPALPSYIAASAAAI